MTFSDAIANRFKKTHCILLCLLLKNQGIQIGLSCQDDIYFRVCGRFILFIIFGVTLSSPAQNINFLNTETLSKCSLFPNWYEVVKHSIESERKYKKKFQNIKQKSKLTKIRFLI